MTHRSRQVLGVFITFPRSIHYTRWSKFGHVKGEDESDIYVGDRRYVFRGKWGEGEKKFLECHRLFHREPLLLLLSLPFRCLVILAIEFLRLLFRGFPPRYPFIPVIGLEHEARVTRHKLGRVTLSVTKQQAGAASYARSCLAWRAPRKSICGGTAARYRSGTIWELSATVICAVNGD
ncbi:hypothetical protein J6590_000235 [Homalodisca vitripennis]|nr:hypothetical protein J6590_000235 [Homalodisca vitripennis]